MARFKLYIEYEGTRYSGWQVQKNVRTIQGKLLEAAEKIFKNEVLNLSIVGKFKEKQEFINILKF